MTYNIVRNLGADGTWASPTLDVVSPPGFKIIRLPSGPAGPPSTQDGGWAPLTGPFPAGEQIGSLVQGHPANYSLILVHTTTGVESPKLFTIDQIRPGVGFIASVAFTLNPGDTDRSYPLVTGLTELAGDYNILVMPDSIQLQDLSVTLVSVP